MNILKVNILKIKIKKLIYLERDLNFIIYKIDDCNSENELKNILDILTIVKSFGNKKIIVDGLYNLSIKDIYNEIKYRLNLFSDENFYKVSSKIYNQTHNIKYSVYDLEILFNKLPINYSKSLVEVIMYLLYRKKDNFKDIVDNYLLDFNNFLECIFYSKMYETNENLTGKIIGKYSDRFFDVKLHEKFKCNTSSDIDNLFKQYENTIKFVMKYLNKIYAKEDALELINDLGLELENVIDLDSEEDNKDIKALETIKYYLIFKNTTCKQDEIMKRQMLKDLRKIISNMDDIDIQSKSDIDVEILKYINNDFHN